MGEGVEYRAGWVKQGREGRDETYRIQPATRMRICLHLQCNIQPINKLHTENLLTELDTRNTELAEPLDAERLAERDVVVVARLVSDCEEELDGGLIVAEVDFDGEGGV
jgi:hypothetical protein